ncbi:hypothetical protein BX666DRAFT_412317 [Dichotomocladium elegans]|nr:hypothetical protein BX666DRAFT_412317 [Dichotomocladium elegans]
MSRRRRTSLLIRLSLTLRFSRMGRTQWMTDLAMLDVGLVNHDDDYFGISRGFLRIEHGSYSVVVVPVVVLRNWRKTLAMIASMIATDGLPCHAKKPCFVCLSLSSVFRNHCRSMPDAWEI